jgi:hypothetical protein
MSHLELAKNEIEQLTPSELTQLKEWFTEFANDAWDKQIEQDSLSGKLDGLIQEALEAKAAGKTRPL